jgi:hypothetical protein
MIIGSKKEEKVDNSFRKAKKSASHRVIKRDKSGD